jgi:hypothetical protein
MITNELLLELKAYVENYLSDEYIDYTDGINYSMNAPMASRAVYEYSEFDEFIEKNKKPSFNKVLFELIDQKKVTDAEIYKKACIDRRLFSKIRSSENYRPGKNTIIALALALELDKTNAEKLLSSTGYTLSESETFDLVIQFCLEKKVYNINDVNLALDYFSLKPLTGAD